MITSFRWFKYIMDNFGSKYFIISYINLENTNKIQLPVLI